MAARRPIRGRRRRLAAVDRAVEEVEEAVHAQVLDGARYEPLEEELEYLPAERVPPVPRPPRAPPGATTRVTTTQTFRAPDRHLIRNIVAQVLDRLLVA